MAYTHLPAPSGADRVLFEEPPTPDHRQVGWHCVYHEQGGSLCFNPLDCDLVPVWALKVPEAVARLLDAGKQRKER